MANQHSIRCKTVDFVSDLSPGCLDPLYGSHSSPTGSYSHVDDEIASTHNQEESEKMDNYGDFDNGPDTSSFSAFIYSLLSKPKVNSEEFIKHDITPTNSDNMSSSNDNRNKGIGKRRIISKGRRYMGRAVHRAAALGGYWIWGNEQRDDFKVKENLELFGEEMKEINHDNAKIADVCTPDCSEKSLLLSEEMRDFLHVSLPTIVQQRKWILLYSTWEHGISLLTLYRRSVLWPGLSLLVIGDSNGVVFGGMVEAPLRPSSQKKYQGTNATFVFTNLNGFPVIFPPTGMNHYFTTCSTEYIAMGGGGHFALYLDSDLANGSSSASETYGNSCLAGSEDFKVKGVELWGFVYDSRYDEVTSLCGTQAAGVYPFL